MLEHLSIRQYAATRDNLFGAGNQQGRPGNGNPQRLHAAGFSLPLTPKMFFGTMGQCGTGIIRVAVSAKALNVLTWQAVCAATAISKTTLRNMPARSRSRNINGTRRMWWGPTAESWHASSAITMGCANRCSNETATNASAAGLLNHLWSITKTERAEEIAGLIMRWRISKRCAGPATSKSIAMNSLRSAARMGGSNRNPDAGLGNGMHAVVATRPRFNTPLMATAAIASTMRTKSRYSPIFAGDRERQTETICPHCAVRNKPCEKAFAGASSDMGGGDSSGTTQEMHGTFLSEMQNQEYTGMIIIGPPGTGKSAFAKSLAGETKRLLIVLDLSGMKSKFVGSSNENLNNALAVIRSVSQGKAFFIATCNAVAQLPTELKRRFKEATYFMDLPSAAERKPIWDIYIKKFGLDTKQKLPVDDNWTGADIKQACQLAWRLRRPLVKAATYLTPVAKTDAARIERLRRDSSGKYLSASHEGDYIYHEQPAGFVPAESHKEKRGLRVAEEN